MKNMMVMDMSEEIKGETIKTVDFGEIEIVKSVTKFDTLIDSIEDSEEDIFYSIYQVAEGYIVAVQDK
jgi:hypothetical protein